MNKFEGFINKLNEIQAKKLAVAGSRDFGHEDRVKTEIKYIIENTQINTIVSGGARGIDTYGEEVANEKKMQKIIHLAEWDKLGRSAGFVRNKNIVQDADAILIYWDGKSVGTKHTVGLAKESKKPLFITTIG